MYIFVHIMFTRLYVSVILSWPGRVGSVFCYFFAMQFQIGRITKVETMP